jgi:hypothetical protein
VNLLRGLLLDNLGIKLVALLLAVLVYLNVYTDRPATMIVTFPIQLTDLADSLSLSGPAPAAVQAELRGTAKQLIRLRVIEPPVKVSLAGVGAGRYERALGPEDLPLPNGVRLQVDRMVSPRTLELQVDRRGHKVVAVAARIEGQLGSAVLWDGSFRVRPGQVTVSGPETVLATLDSVILAPVSVSGHRDTLRVSVGPRRLPDWCTMDPERVEVRVPLVPGVTRRFALDVEAPRGGADFLVAPPRVIAMVTSARRLPDDPAATVRAVWWAPAPYAAHVGHRVVVRGRGRIPPGATVRFDPDSVILLAP